MSFPIPKGGERPGRLRGVPGEARASGPHRGPSDCFRTFFRERRSASLRCRPTLEARRLRCSSTPDSSSPKAIAAYRRFASRKVVLLHQPAVYPFCRMALVPRVFKVLFQPLVDDLVMGGPSTGKGCVFLGEYLSIPPEGLFHGVFRMPGFPGYFAHVLAVRSLRGLYVFVLIHPEDTFPPASSSWCSFTTAKPRLGGQFSAVVRSKKSGQVKSVKITAVSISLAIHKRMIMTCHNRRETVKVKVSIGQPLCTR